MISKTHKAHMALFGANLIYGINYIVAKGIMPDKIGPSAFVFIRLFCGTILFWIVKSFIKEKVDQKDMLRLVVCGFLGAATNQLLFFNGLSLTSPVDASIIMTSTPILVLIFSVLVLNEKITSVKLWGTALAATGAIVLILYGSRPPGTGSLLGNILVFLNTMAYALYLVIVKPLITKYNPLTLISWIFLFGFIFMLPFGLHEFISTDVNAFTLNTFLAIGFVVIFTTFFAYLFNIYALKFVSPSVNSSYIYLQPVVNFVIVSLSSFLLVDNTYAQDINLVKILSCILVISGVYLVSKTKTAETSH
ncbi:DMT family transporter [Aestuariivivens sediminis]|uniref:DMT family transporter n=1 Tax=Aestuariivivens sediminis TaxID=2913557 RepID=UPI001F5A7BDA|nr:DMT family transporter [Aestuariivivens sediminis]